MKRDMDFVRELLLKIEADTGPGQAFDLEAMPKVDHPKVTYHLGLLHDAGLIDAAVHDITTFGDAGRTIMVQPFGLTWDGHEYLDTIRDPEVWRKTRAAAMQAGGFSLKVLASVATAMAIEGAKRAAGLG